MSTHSQHVCCEGNCFRCGVWRCTIHISILTDCGDWDKLWHISYIDDNPKVNMEIRSRIPTCQLWDIDIPHSWEHISVYTFTVFRWKMYTRHLALACQCLPRVLRSFWAITWRKTELKLMRWMINYQHSVYTIPKSTDAFQLMMNWQ